MLVVNLVASVRAEVEAWCRGRSFLWRAPLLLYFAWECFKNFHDSFAWTVFGGITLGIHELGHVLFSFAGEFLSVAGGSFSQLAAPFITACLFLKQRDYFGISIAGVWLGLSLNNLAVYIGDAQAQALPLVSIGGGDALHDWTYLLTHFGWLAYDRQIAGLTRLIGIIVSLASVAFGAWLCYRMAVSKARAADFE